jgi:serpin B
MRSNKHIQLVLIGILAMGLASAVAVVKSQGAAEGDEMGPVGPPEPDPEPVLPDGDAEALVGGNVDFALDLYRAMASENGNLFYSPHSISTALAMIYAGARGETAAQMADALRFGLPQARLHAGFRWLDWQLARRTGGAHGLVLRVSNALWAQTGLGFEAECLELLDAYYGSALRELDLSAEPERSRQRINAWVAQQTEQRIRQLLPFGAVTPDTRLVLTNAVYFYGPWEHAFPRAATRDGAFRRLDGTEVTVPMMEQTEYFRYTDGDGYVAVELRYQGGEVSMLIVMPDEGVFESFESGLDREVLTRILGELHSTELDLRMPRLELESRLSLRDVLSSLGMPLAFDPQRADFSGITADAALAIDAIVHQANLSVDERGTEAVAATSVAGAVTWVPPDPIEVTLDRPFVLFIRDNPTGELLFAGRVADPS